MGQNSLPALTAGEEKKIQILWYDATVVWLGVELREEPLKIWTRYKE